ncbi:MAG: hypothetical protein K0M48_02850 [Thiobacillus sp.]|nr:hypothetical protein [Thiobacillus sp.]
MKMLAVLISGAVLMTGFPHMSNAAERHLIYMQGCCVKQASSAVAKDYQKIAQALRDSGFNVFFELRTSDMTDSDEQAQAYAAKIAQYVQNLLTKGVAPENITVSGFSLGSSTALVASGLIANPKVNYVLLAGCPVGASRVAIDYTKVRGRVLSILDSKDDKFGSCAGHLPSDVTFKEITLDSGEGHKVFRLADEYNLNLWKAPLETWAKGQ